MMRSRVASILALLTFVTAGDALAQAERNDLWPTFTVGVAAYQIDAHDKIAIDGTANVLGREVDFNRELGLPDSDSLLAVSLGWAFAERHSLALRYFGDKRDGSRSLTRSIDIGDQHFPVGASARASLDTTTIEAVYDYWFVRLDRVGVAGSFGLVYLGVDASASATFTAGSGGASTTRRVKESTDLPVPMIGLAVKASPLDRLILYAGARYLPSVTIGDIQGTASSFSAGAEYYVYGPLAVGASYDGNTYRVDVDKDDWRGDVDLVAKGWKLYLRASF